MSGEAFRDFEHAAWEKAAQAYSQGFAAITPQAAEVLARAAGAAPGKRLLDLATGPGYAAAAAARQGAEVLGVDFSATVVELARQGYPELKFEVGDAEKLNFPDASFDGAMMNFLVMHLAKPELAVTEAARILKPGGILAFSAWGLPEEAKVFGLVQAALKKHGNPDVPLPAAPSFFKYSDPEISKSLLESCGFHETKVEKAPQTWRFENPDTVFEVMMHGTVRTGALLRAQTPQAKEAIATALREELLAYRSKEGFEIPMPALIVSGKKKPA